MPDLLFTLGPVAVGQMHDMLICLAKFDEDISVEGTRSELRLSGLNISKTAHASFRLSSNSDFFEKYHCSPALAGAINPTIWSCRLQNRALAAVFRKRSSEGREKDTALERCEFELQATPNNPECRLIIRLICRLGIVKTYRLTYETTEVLHASFDRIAAPNTWSVSSRTLQDVVEYFGPKTEQLDWYLKNGQVIFTSYTEKVQNGKEVLKQPMHTSVSLKKKDFDECKLEEDQHIGIIVRDFRAIVAHADTLRAHVTARYSHSNRPMQLSYNNGEVVSEFTLMTRGTAKGPTGPVGATPARDLSVRPITQPLQSSRSASIATMLHPNQSQTSTMMSRDHSRDPGRATSRPNSPPPPSARINEESLFIPVDDDHHWDAPTFEDDQEFVTWDEGNGFAEISAARKKIRDARANTAARSTKTTVTEDVREIEPTQRLSQVRGLFD